MEIGKTLYITHRNEWREWLEKNYKIEPEIWLIFYKKASGKKRLPYNDAVEEALCFGWIDSILKGIDNEKFAQRFTPRKPNSVLSELNKERVIRLIKDKKMKADGLKAIEHAFDIKAIDNNELIISDDIMKALKENTIIFENFNAFPESYKRIRIGWIESARSRPEIFEQRLRYFLKMTEKNKKYGMVQ